MISVGHNRKGAMKKTNINNNNISLNNIVYNNYSISVLKVFRLDVLL